MSIVKHKIITDTLPTGTRVVGICSTSFSYSIVAAFFKRGARNDSPHKTGLSHLFEHVLLHRTIGESSHEQRLMKLESAGIAFDAMINQEVSVFYHSQLVDQCVLSAQLLLEGLARSVITASDVEREKKIIIDECFRNMQDPQYRLSRSAMKQLYPLFALSLPVTGTPRLFKKITMRDVNAVRHFYAPEQATYIVIGRKQDFLAAQRVIKKAVLGDVPHKMAHRTQPPTRMLPAIKNHIVFCGTKKTKPRQLYVGVYFRTCSYNQEPDQTVLSFIRYYLAGSWISRLLRQIRFKDKASYGIDFDADTFVDTGYLGFQFSLARADIEQSIKSVLHECALLKQRALTHAQLEPHKTSMIADIVKTSSNPDSLLDWYKQDAVFANKIISQDAYISCIKKIDGHMIQKIAAMYFTPERLVVALDMPEIGNMGARMQNLIKKAW